MVFSFRIMFGFMLKNFGFYRYRLVSLLILIELICLLSLWVMVGLMVIFDM